jgi:UPF0716 protein FxsA
MTDTRPLARFLERDYLFKLILFLLVYAAVPVGEIFLFIWLGNLIGNYLTFALAAVAGVVGAFVALSQAMRMREKLREKLGRGADAGVDPLVDAAGLLVSAVLLLTPGFFTDLVGYVLLVPAARSAVGRFVVRKMGRSADDVRAYLLARAHAASRPR